MNVAQLTTQEAEALPVPSVTEDIGCVLCGAHDASLVIPSTLGRPDERGDWSAYRCTSGGYGYHGPIVKCNRCGLVYANPRVQSREVVGIYEAVKDPLYVEERLGRVLTFEHHLRPLEKRTGPGSGRRLLDVGAYTGVFVEIAAQHGWDAWGVEPSAWAVGVARAEGLQMSFGTLEEATFPDAGFSVVTMWDVIEHVADPYATLQEAWRILEPGGWLAVHTMDIDSLFSRLMGKHWPWYMQMHLFYFSRKTMASLLKRAGFEVAWMGAQGRYLHIGYLASRIAALSPRIGRPVEAAVNRLGLRSRMARVNLGDLFTTYARKAP